MVLLANKRIDGFKIVSYWTKSGKMTDEVSSEESRTGHFSRMHNRFGGLQVYSEEDKIGFK